MINNNRKSDKPISVLNDANTNTVTGDSIKIANIMNKNFVSIGQTLATKVPDKNKHFTDYVTDVNQLNSFFFTPITEDEIEREIIATPNNKSYGLCFL